MSPLQTMPKPPLLVVSCPKPPYGSQTTSHGAILAILGWPHSPDTFIYISWKCVKVQKMGAKLYDGRWYGGKDRLNSSPIMSKASIWIPKVMPWCNIGNVRLATQSRHIYISWKCEESAKNGGKIIWWSMVWREGRAEFFSHHDQSLHMSVQGNAMVQYWQY